MSRRFRWAPTPSGPLHLGNLFSMLLTWLDARVAGGEVLLRIDDLDSTRARPEFVQEIFRVVESLGLDWQLGPRSFEDFETGFSQKRSQGFYAAAFEEALACAPELFFACSCSRKDLSADLVYPGTCRSRGLPLVSDGTVTWRVRSELLPESARALGDVVLFRKERLFAYQWVSLQEDLRWKVTDIHRGEDLRSSTELQLGLAFALSSRGLHQYDAFSRVRFIHHPLILDGEKKLSKSEGAQAVGRWLGHPEKIFSAFLKWMGAQETGSVRTASDLLAWYRSSKADGFTPSFSARFQLSQLMD
jgi:glutamyl/glutaminyl-tRNA synthetase